MFIEAYMRGGDFDINELMCSLSDDTSTRYQVGDGSDCRKFPVDIQQLTRPMALLRLVRVFEQSKPHTDMPLFLKTHNANLIANGVTLLPEQLTLATIHIVRDPRDVVISFAKHMGRSIDIAIGFMEDKYRVLSIDLDRLKVVDLLSSWEFHTKSFVDGDLINCKTFRYEDMCADPASVFFDIMKHTGITPYMDKVRAALKAVELSKLRAREKKEGFIEASPKNKEGFFGRGGSYWHEILTPGQQHRVEKFAGSYMKKFGYLESKVA
jgi:hypothetical protein